MVSPRDAALQQRPSEAVLREHPNSGGYQQDDTWPGVFAGERNRHPPAGLGLMPMGGRMLMMAVVVFFIPLLVLALVPTATRGRPGGRRFALLGGFAVGAIYWVWVWRHLNDPIPGGMVTCAAGLTAGVLLARWLRAWTRSG